MLTKEQLDLKLYPIECWINVFQYYKRGMAYSTKQSAIDVADNALKLGVKTLYRIHVKLK